MKKTFIATSKVDADSTVSSFYFAFRGNQLLINRIDEQIYVPQYPEAEMPEIRFLRRQNIGYYDGIPCYSLELHESVEPPKNMEFQTLRELFFRIDEDLLQIAGRAYHVVNWDRVHLFCCRC